MNQVILNISKREFSQWQVCPVTEAPCLSLGRGKATHHLLVPLNCPQYTTSLPLQFQRRPLRYPLPHRLPHLNGFHLPLHSELPSMNY